MIIEDKEYLLISGLQHFSFCRRQWALIHVEQQWVENGLTAEGRIIHNRVHDASLVDIRGGIITMRDMPVKSERLGISGCCDAVEFFRSDDGITLHGRQGLWGICPVEYKHGHQKSDNCDRLQVTAQAMCLEEMFSCKIDEGAVFYHETRKKEKFCLTDELRETVRLSFEEMHSMFSRGYTPIVKKHRGCSSCSLKEICLPSLQQGKGFVSAKDYLRLTLDEEKKV